MLSTILSAPFWIFIICLAGAVVTWLAADQFRDQILADSHKLVREVALRYLQFMIGLFTVFLMGIIFSAGSFFTQSFRVLGGTPIPIETQMMTPTSTTDPFFNPPTLTSLPTEPIPIPTATIPSPDTDPTLASVRSATVVNTGGVGVNLRDEPGLGGLVMVVIPEGARVTLRGDVMEADGFQWFLIVGPDGREGWVVDSFLDIGE